MPRSRAIRCSVGGWLLKSDASNGELRVVSPKLPAQAVPGIYMLFVVDKDGVPSVAKKVVIRPETRGFSPAFR